jgi:hypothetical protein
MPRICPQCAHENPDYSAFCVRCGLRFSHTGKHLAAGDNTPGFMQQSEKVQQPDFAFPPAGQQDRGVPLPQTPFPEPVGGQQAWGAPPPVAAPPASSAGNEQQAWNAPPSQTPFPGQPPAPGGQASWSAPLPPASPSVPAGASPPYNGQPGQQWNMPAARPPYVAPQAGGVISAFAGYGTRISNRSWFLTSKQEEQESMASLATALKEKLQQASYPGAAIRSERLVEHGSIMNGRDYLLLQSGSLTEFIYVAPGENILYISRTTAVQPPVSIIRVGLAALLLFIVLIGPFIGLILPFSIALIHGFACIILGLLLAATLSSGLRDKDFLRYLRTNHLSDFQIDDVAQLEARTDRALRATAQQVGLDSDAITPPEQGYLPARRIRFF